MAAAESLLAAVLAVQKEAPPIAKSATNPHFKSKFAPLDEIVQTIDPILHKHGLVWMTLPVRDEHGDPALRYRLAHAPTGETVEGTMPLLLSKKDAQGQGSAITYARRYALCAVLNLVADDDDDGGRAAAERARRAQLPEFGEPIADESIPKVLEALAFVIGTDPDPLVQAIMADAGGYMPRVVGRSLLRVAAARKANAGAPAEPAKQEELDVT